MSTTATRPLLPVQLIVDTSTSMGAHADVLRRATSAALDRAWGRTFAPAEPLVGVITVGGAARVARPLGPPVDPGTDTDFDVDGASDLTGAIDLLVAEHERVSAQGEARGVPTLRPWVVIVTDGRWPGAHSQSAIERLHAPPRVPVVCPVGVGDVDETTLSRLATESGYAVDTPEDLVTVLPALLDALLAAAVVDPDHAPALDAPPGSRHLEGW